MKSADQKLQKSKIEKKLLIAAELFEMAFRENYTQLKKEFPELEDRELRHRAYALIEKACS